MSLSELHVSCMEGINKKHRGFREVREAMGIRANLILFELLFQSALGTQVNPPLDILFFILGDSNGTFTHVSTETRPSFIATFLPMSRFSGVLRFRNVCCTLLAFLIKTHAFAVGNHPNGQRHQRWRNPDGSFTRTTT